MNLFSFSGLLIGILCTSLGSLALFKGKKLIHFIWALFSFSVAIWGFGSYGVGISKTAESATLWWRIGYVGVILIPVFFTHFVHAFLELKRKWIVVLVYILGILFLVFNFYNGLFINNVRFLFNQFYYLYYPPVLYTLFIFLFFGLTIYTHLKLLNYYKKSVGIKRNQIKYFLLATTPGFLAGALEFLPVYKIEFYPYFHFVIALSPLTVTYAILRFRLMDIRVVVRKATIYFWAAMLVYAMFYFTIWFYNTLFGGVYASNAYLMGLILSPLFVLVFVWLNEGAKKIANKYLFFSLYNVQETMARLTDELTNSIDLSKIVDSIVNSIKDAMQLDRAGILLIDQKEETTKYKIAKVIGFNEHNGISLVQDNFLTQHLEKTQRPLVLDELQMIVNDSNDEAVKQNFNQLAENMKHIEASLCVPMIISNKLIGIIVLGAKVSGDAYTSDDLNLLGTLAKQAAIAIDNARLYEQVQDFNKTLQQKVDEQTQEIKKAYEIEKQANQELKQLDEAKTQFILITQHHLRTPLSVNMGFLDLLKQGSYGKVPAKMRKPIKELIDSTQKEIRLVDELLDVSSYQLGTKIINLKSNVDVSSLIKETLKDLKIEAENKGIYLKYKKRGVVPETSADSGKLKMALTNIVDNCVKYTKKGGVSIILKSKDNKILIDIEDTGMGMTQEQLSNLFGQTFQRGQEAQKIFAVGKGIGLFLSAKIIEGHNGKIFAESKGEGEGSTFHIELPVV